jgi:hypothetical protein
MIPIDGAVAMRTAQVPGRGGCRKEGAERPGPALDSVPVGKVGRQFHSQIGVAGQQLALVGCLSRLDRPDIFGDDRVQPFFLLRQFELVGIHGSISLVKQFA